MPRKAEWIHQLPAALMELRRFTAPVVDRSALESLLQVERRTAIRLMHLFGGFQAGKTFLIDRQQLIFQLEQLARGEDVIREQDRRARLGDELKRIRRLSPARAVRIETAPGVHDRVLKDLPMRIHLRPGELLVTFSGAADLAAKLFELSQL